MKSLDVLLVEDEPLMAEMLSHVLEARGHRVRVFASAEAAVHEPEVDVVVTDVRLGNGSGLDLLKGLRQRGTRARAIVMTGLPTFETCREALHLGASEVLAKPFQIDELVAAVEGQEPSANRAPRLNPCCIGLSTKTAAAVARRVSAFALERGAPLSARARLASAAAEIAQNVCDHAFAKGIGDLNLEAWQEGNSIFVRISDEGRGFQLCEEGRTHAASVLDGGLARVQALVEDLEIKSCPGIGTRVTLRVLAASTRFDSEDMDLSDEDFLLPVDALRVLKTIGEEGGPDVEHLPAHLAVCIGRLLAGPDPRAILRTTLRS